MLVYDVDSWECLGVHKVYATSGYAVMDHAYACVFLDENLNPRLTIASGTSADCAFYVQQNEDVQASSALEVTSGGSITVATTVRTPKAGGDTMQEKNFSRVVVNHRNVGGTTAGITRWKVAYQGTGETGFSTATAMLMAGSTTIPTGWTQSGGCYKSEAVGIAPVQSRWVQYQFTNDTSQSSATRATMDQVTILGAITDTDYSRR